MAKTYKAGQKSKFFCTACGKEGIPILRKRCCERKSGHLKKLYCIYCKKEVNHCEIKEYGDYTYEDFLNEFNAGRFIDGNRVELEKCFSCTKKDCQYNINGKCWNASNTNNCNHKPKEEILND